MSARRAVVAFLLATVLLLLCAVPAGAASKPSAATRLHADVSRLSDELALLGYAPNPLELSRRTTFSQIKFRNHDGYTFVVIAAGQTVTISVVRNDRKKRFSIATYFAHGRVTSTSIRASFADRGRIELRFRPSGSSIRATRRVGCAVPNKRAIAGIGLFVGTLRFQGEDGYTSAEVHRVRGRSIDFGALLACLRGAAPGPRALSPPRSPLAPAGLRGLASRAPSAAPRVPETDTQPPDRTRSTILLANRKLPISRTIFAALRGGGEARFLAADSRSEGSIGIVRRVSVAAPPSAFVFDRALSSAAVGPPAPFVHGGSFEQGSSTRSWSGPLAVSFLGAPRVPLTGPSFGVQLQRNW